jgi:hypothetical protein
MTEALITLAAALGQLGVAAAAYKIAVEVKRMVTALKERVDNHEERLTKLEDK